MALKQLLLTKKIRNKEMELETFVEEKGALEDKEKELEEAMDEAVENEELDAVEESIQTLDKEKTALLEKIEATETELADLNAELETLNERSKQKPIKEGEKRMGKTNIDTVELREGIEAYVRSKGEDLAPEVRDKFTTVEGGALIPEKVYAIEVEDTGEIDMTRFVETIQVSSPTGKVPLIKHSDGVMATVEELAKNPELAVPTFSDVRYEVATYRGYVPISEEVIDDADYDVVGLIAKDVQLQEQRTKNNKIIEALKSAPAKTVTSLDDIKTMFNIDFSKRYGNTRAIISSSLYNALDMMKGEDGQYLLQPNVTVGSGKTLFGKELLVVDDDVIGNQAGDMVGFFGDSKAAVKLFDRKKSTVKWVDHDVYGQMLAIYSRFSVDLVDEDAGFYVTFEGTPGV